MLKTIHNSPDDPLPRGVSWADFRFIRDERRRRFHADVSGSPAPTDPTPPQEAPAAEDPKHKTLRERWRRLRAALEATKANR